MPMKREMTDPRLVRQRRTIIFRRSMAGLFLLLVLTYISWGRLVAEVSNVQFLTRREVSQSVPLEGILIKNENVLRAPVSGKLHLTTADGDRLEAGAKAAQVLAVQTDNGGEAYDIATTVAGICCTHLDGLEQVLSPDNIEVLVVPELEKIGDKAIADGVRVEKGQPILKIVDNLSPMYIYAETPKLNFPDFTADKPIWLQAAWEEQTLSVKPHKVSDKGDRWVGYYMLSAYPDQLLHQRKILLNVTTRTMEGFLVPHGAVVDREGQPGIFLSIKKKAHWMPVTIEGELEGMLAVSGPELDADSRYINNPLLAREGHRVE